MLNNLLQVQKDTKLLLEQNSPETDWKGQLNLFNKALTHLQRERQMHLLVMLAVGLALLMSGYITILHPVVLLFVLDGIFMVLFVAYVFHYHFLENTTQGWYETLRMVIKKLH